jgi:predicted nucleic acid-binding protein
MERLVLDAGPLIALVSQQDKYHEQAKAGFQRIPMDFGEVITPLPILFEVYKFVSRHESVQAARLLLTLLQEETVIQTIDQADFMEIFEWVTQSVHWQGTLEDASVLVVARQCKGQIWTIDYKDLAYFESVEFWNP